MPPFKHYQAHRLRYFNYASAATWFVTINTWERQKIFGAIRNGEMQLSDWGKIVAEEWLKSAEIRKEVLLGEFVVMPDHFHAIITIQPEDVQQPRWLPGMKEQTPPRGPSPKSLGALIAGFKSIVTIKINNLRQSKTPPVWQKNYYDRIIRSADALQSITMYIRQNPANFRSQSES